MSIISNLTGKSAAPAISSGEVQQRLNAAQSQACTLDQECGGLALAAESGDAGAIARLATLETDLQAAKVRVARLQAALAGAKEQEEAKLREKQAALQRSQFAACRTHLAARDKAAAALTDALAEATKQYAILLKRSDQAHAANPLGAKFPDGALCAFTELKNMVVLEICRLGAAAGIEESLPTEREIDNAIAIEPLSAAIRDASAHVVKVLTARIAA